MPITPGVSFSVLAALLLVSGMTGPALAANSDLVRPPAEGAHFRKMTASDKVPRGTPCTTYVPAYSNIYLFESGSIPMAINLSVRNTDAKSPLYIQSINYYGADGTLLEDVLTDTRILAPMATATYVIDQHDMRGGSGANFYVSWKAESGTEEPLVEAVMAGYRGSKGLSFSSRGVHNSGCQRY